MWVFSVFLKSCNFLTEFCPGKKKKKIEKKIRGQILTIGFCFGSGASCSGSMSIFKVRINFKARYWLRIEFLGSVSIFGVRIDFWTQSWVLGWETGIGHRVVVSFEFLTRKRFLRSAPCIDFLGSETFFGLRIEFWNMELLWGWNSLFFDHRL